MAIYGAEALLSGEPDIDVYTCASAAEIVERNVDSRGSGDLRFEREVGNVVVNVNVDKDTQRKIR